MRTLELHILSFMLISFSSFAQEQGDWRMQPVYNKDGVQVGLFGEEIFDEKSIDGDLYVVDTLTILSHEVAIQTEVFISGRTDGDYFSRYVRMEVEKSDKNTCCLIFYSTLTGDVVWLEIKRKGEDLYIVEKLEYSHRTYYGIILDEADMDYVRALGIHRKKVNIPVNGKIVYWEHFSDFYKEVDGVESYYCPVQYSIKQGLEYMNRKHTFSNQEFYEE